MLRVSALRCACPAGVLSGFGGDSSFGRFCSGLIHLFYRSRRVTNCFSAILIFEQQLFGREIAVSR